MRSSPMMLVSAGAGPRVGREDVVDGELLLRGYVVLPQATLATVGTMSTNRSRPARNSSTHTSLAAL